MGTYEYQDASQLQRLLYIKIEKYEPNQISRTGGHMHTDGKDVLD